MELEAEDLQNVEQLVEPDTRLPGFEGANEAGRAEGEIGEIILRQPQGLSAISNLPPQVCQ